jgi:AcrR family transcriptional regulator
MTATRRLTGEARREVIEQAATEVFARAGYHGASMDTIARASGVSVPVLYDHFASKKELHRSLLERHFAELRALWRAYSVGDDPPEQRIARSIDAWFAYVETHPYAWRMLFRETSGDPEVQAIHAEVAAQSRAQLLPLLARVPGLQHAGGSGPEAVEMAWEVFRGVLQSLALWWYEHRDVPRARVLATAMNALWLGFDRVRQGESWQGV